jgi:hypothetical protein
VGAAVLPGQAKALSVPLDVGRDAGKIVGPLERLTAYSCMPGSGVDVLRFGLEDTPFFQGSKLEIRHATNLDLAEFVFDRVAYYGGSVVTDPVHLRHFASAETRFRAAGEENWGRV